MFYILAEKRQEFYTIAAIHTSPGNVSITLRPPKDYIRRYSIDKHT